VCGIRIGNADPDGGKSAPKRKKVKSEDQKKIIKINISYAIIF
jgi:hypothetical protein